MSYSCEIGNYGHSCGCGTYPSITSEELERLKKDYELKLKFLEAKQEQAIAETERAKQALIDSSNTIASQQDTIRKQQLTIDAQQTSIDSASETITSQQQIITTQQEIANATAKIIAEQQQTIERLSEINCDYDEVTNEDIDNLFPDE